MNTSSPPPNQQSGKLTALQIPSIDISENAGLGWADLKDPQKGVALFAVKPPGIVKGDLIELWWNGQVIQSLFANPDRSSIDFSVLPQDIPDEPEVCEVFYRITPAAGGTPEDSPVRQVRAKRSVPGGLDTDNYSPYINDNLAPVENLPSHIEVPADLPLTIAAWDNMQEGDILRVFWGSREFVVENPPLPSSETGKPQTVIVPIALQLEAGNGDTFTVCYEIRDRVSNWSGYSLVAFTTVDIFVTPAPTVKEAPDGELDPMLALAGATVVVAYPDMRDTDSIRVRWDGHEDVTDPATLPGNPAGSVQFTVKPAAIASALGKTFQVTYVITRGPDEQESDPLPLKIQALPDSVLPTPGIPKAGWSKMLPVQILEADVSLTVQAWPFIATDQRIWLRFEGTAEDGSAHNWNHPIWQDFAITTDTAQNTNVALSELQKLKGGSNLRLIMEISFDGGLSRTQLPIETIGIIVYHPVSGSEDWQTFQKEELPLGVDIPCSNGSDLRIFDVPASIVDVRGTYPEFGDRTLQLTGDSSIAFNCGGFIETLTLSHARADSDENYISFFDIMDVEIARETIQSGTTVVTYKKTLNSACRYFRIIIKNNTDTVLLDNLSWTAWSP
ncbi:hypothetical protein [Pseudomonas cichorii]|uniref:hypothetical protein n=1 Tax=Pseudomonas cichorii TaxID=36746 RepID=UPI001C89F1F0|nr:hypothetical protein [Pseudomonas cichorii]MBX8494959.1 hypothetical protein [Pseudomonas cichorii]